MTTYEHTSAHEGQRKTSSTTEGSLCKSSPLVQHQGRVAEIVLQHMRAEGSLLGNQSISIPIRHGQSGPREDTGVAETELSNDVMVELLSCITPPSHLFREIERTLMGILQSHNPELCLSLPVVHTMLSMGFPGLRAQAEHAERLQTPTDPLSLKFDIHRRPTTNRTSIAIRTPIPRSKAVVPSWLKGQWSPTKSSKPRGRRR